MINQYVLLITPVQDRLSSFPFFLGGLHEPRYLLCFDLKLLLNPQCGGIELCFKPYFTMEIAKCTKEIHFCFCTFRLIW